VRGAGNVGRATAPVLRAEKPEDVRCLCPVCGSDCVSNAYRVSGRYEVYWECLGTLAKPEDRTCDYRVVFPTGKLPRVLGEAAEVKR
jgi:hypothetical protein